MDIATIGCIATNLTSIAKKERICYYGLVVSSPERPILVPTAIFDSLPTPGFQRTLLNREPKTERFVRLRLGRFSGPEQAEIGNLILIGLSLGGETWDEDTQRTAASVFSRLDLRDASDADLGTLRNNYLQAVEGQRDILDAQQRSTDALLTIGESLMPQLLARGRTEELASEMRTAWAPEETSVSSGGGGQVISERVEGMVDLIGRGQSVLGRDPAVARRRGWVFALSRQEMTQTQIQNATDISISTITNDLVYLRGRGLVEEDQRRQYPAMIQNRNRVLELAKQGMTLTQIGNKTGLHSRTVSHHLAHLRGHGLLKDEDLAVSKTQVQEPPAKGVIVDFKSSEG